MPKKSKVNKLSRMSDDERARYLQHRADLEEEARQRKRELIAKFIKNKLDKEEGFSRINTAKLNQGWRFILRKIKCNQMRLDIQGMVSSFNFMLDRKNRLVTSLMSALDDADEQHRRSFEAHAETLSYFLGIGALRLDKLQTEYEHHKNSLLENWDKEELDISGSQERAELKLKIIIYIQGRDFDISKKEKSLEFATIKNDTRLEHEEEMRSLCRPKQLEIEQYWTRLREVYSAYLEQHKPIIGHYQMLREKDEFYQRDIARNELLIQQASETMLSLQNEWQKTTKTMESKLKRMNIHKENLANRYWQMKKEYNLERSGEEKQFEMMVLASQNAVKHLDEILEKLNKINTLADICHKFEKDDDKIGDSEKNESEEPVDFKHLDDKMIDEYQEYNKMEKFLRKANNVKVQTLCLRAEKSKLLKENIQLKNYIKKYLTDLALKGNRSRPVSVNMPAPRNGTRLNRPVTCIEGALSNAVLHEKRMKLERKNKGTEIMKSYPRLQCWM